MSANYKQLIPTYAILLAALSFTVSSLPDLTSRDSATLSSETANSYNYHDNYMDSADDNSIFRNSCDPYHILNSGKSTAQCGLRTKTMAGPNGDFRVTGMVNVEIKTVSRRSEEDMDKMEQVKKVFVTVKTKANGNERKGTLEFPAEDWTEVDSKIIELYNDQAESLRDMVSEHDKFVNCEQDRSGRSISEDKKPDCRLDRLSHMSNNQQAAEYYNKYFKNDLERLLKSPNPDDQTKGMAMLALLQQSGIRSQYVKDALASAEQYVKYQTDMAGLNSKLQNMNPQERARFLQQYGYMMNEDMRARITALDNKSYADPSMLDTVAGYTTSLNEHMNAIVQMNAQVTAEASGLGRVTSRARPDFMGGAQPSTGGGIPQRGTTVTVASPADVANTGGNRGDGRGSVVPANNGIPNSGAPAPPIR